MRTLRTFLLAAFCLMSAASQGANTYRYEGDTRATGDVIAMKSLRGTSALVTLFGQFGSFVIPGHQTNAQLLALGLDASHTGAISYSTTDNALKYWNGTTWVTFGGGLAGSQETCEEFATAWDTNTNTRTGATNAAVTTAGTPLPTTVPKEYRNGLLMPPESVVLSNSNRTSTIATGFQPVFDEVWKVCYWSM